MILRPLHNIWARNAFNFCFLPLGFAGPQQRQAQPQSGDCSPKGEGEALAMKGSPRDVLGHSCLHRAPGHARAVGLNSLPAVRLVQQQSPAIPQGTGKPVLVSPGLAEPQLGSALTLNGL